MYVRLSKPGEDYGYFMGVWILKTDLIGHGFQESIPEKGVTFNMLLVSMLNRLAFIFIDSSININNFIV